MKKVLIAYFSLSGNTEKMAQYIAEGVRFSGQEAVVKKVSDIKTAGDLAGYDGYIFGSPTHNLDIAEPMKRFLSLGLKPDLEGKLGGAFGSYKHDASYVADDTAPKAVFNIIQKEYKMVPFDLGPFSLKDALMNDREGMRACQDYGRVFGEKLTALTR